MHEPTFKSLNELFTVPGIIAPELREIVAVAPVSLISPVSPAEAILTIPESVSSLAALIEEARGVLEKLQKALGAVIPGAIDVIARSAEDATNQSRPELVLVIEGVFNGREMIADDGSHYTVPENYASKSRLLEGDMLQMIKEDGRNYFKQKERVLRTSITARLLSIDISSGIAVTENGERYSILHAPLKFFRVTPGDTLTLEIPAIGGEWAAVVGKVVGAKETCYTPSSFSGF